MNETIFSFVQGVLIAENYFSKKNPLLLLLKNILEITLSMASHYKHFGTLTLFMNIILL